jgi:16S rRNA (adenine1518-N6/adenine1519-N6)-dimethyltransferase
MTSPRVLLNAWDLKAKKRWGQNFLCDSAIAEAIVKKARLSETDRVLEIGPGLGALTVPLSKVVRTVVAIEKDSRFISLLGTELTLAGVDNVDVRQGDFLKLSPEDLPWPDDRQWVAIGNLPYSISTQIIVRLIAYRRRFRKAVFMFQRELADRLMAAPGSRDYGRISVILQYCSQVSKLMGVDASRFFPRPKVDSTVLDIRFTDTGGMTESQENHFFEVVRSAFSKRRKTLKNALAGSGHPEWQDHLMDAFSMAQITPTRRAETLSVEEFLSLSRCLGSLEAGMKPDQSE